MKERLRIHSGLPGTARQDWKQRRMTPWQRLPTPP
nr:MAG TPA: hypothetical protein [Caudoviricetes sp.]